MLFTDINRQLANVFESGRLPSMVYINKQDYKRNKVDRPLHSHDSICEILLIYKGSGIYHVNDKRYPLTEGSVVFYNQGDLHEVSSVLDTEIGDYCVGITNLYKKGLKCNHLVAKDEPFVRQSGHLFPLLKELCEQMYTLDDMNEYGKLASQLLCASFVVITSQLSSFVNTEASTFNDDEKFVTRIINYLNEHFVDDISLNEVAAYLGCSASYISHAFKKSMGTTPIQYVIRRRIGLAQTLLISTDLPATHIATMVGYENTNYFINSFAKIVGMTPIRYRNFYLEELKGKRNQS